jgi:hypothetical protein
MLTPEPAGRVTVIDALPEAPFREALMEVEPVATPVARPPALTVATEVLATVQVAVAVTSVGEPPGLVAVAVNCCVAPATKLAGLGEIEMVVAVTFKGALPLTPLKVAVTVVGPAATPVARPVALTVATPVLADFHVAETTFVELSL